MSPTRAQLAAPIIEPPEPGEELTDELIAGDAAGSERVTLRLLASGVVVRPQYRELRGELVPAGEIFARHLDNVELTQVLAATRVIVRRAARRIQQLAQANQELEQRVAALEAAQEPTP